MRVLRGNIPRGNGVSTQTGIAWAIAGEIAQHLVRSAFVYHGECTWMGTVQRGGAMSGASEFTYEALGPDVYGGTAGIALFLAEWHARTGDLASGVAATRAARFAAARLGRVPPKFRSGFYSGRIGIAYVLARSGPLLRTDEFRTAAARELDLQRDDTGDDTLLDVISGAAGAVAPTLALARDLARDDLITLAERLGDRIVAGADRGDHGLSWGAGATGFSSPAPLTGFAHGAAGMAWALMELFTATGHERFLEAARDALRYEDTVFNATEDNWPDLRYSAATGAAGHYGMAWCAGAPGIGLSRIRLGALDTTSAQPARDVAAAIRAVRLHASETPNVADDDFSLCHGWAGLGDFLLAASRGQESGAASVLLERIVTQGADAHAGHPGRWRCGMQRGSTPSLMLGLAGIGHFFLRVADPTVPSVLLVSPFAGR